MARNTADDAGIKYIWDKLIAKLALKVDKEAGKGLSANDYTTTEKNKLAGIEAGAQVNPTIDSALSDSSVNAVQNKIVKAALDGKAGREEIPTVNDNTITIQLNGTTIESFTLNQATDETINIQVTKSSVGLGNVPNVGTNDQTPTFTQASTRTNIASGEKLSVIFGKIMKWFADLKTVAFSGSYTDLSNTPTIPSAANDGTLTIKQNGTSKGTFTANQSGNSTIELTDTTYESKNAASGGTVVSLVTTGEKYTWNNKSNFSGSYNDLSNKPTLGTASAKDVPASGNASTSQVVMGNDTRLTNSRPASDVYSWAKAVTKPTYSKSEIGLGNVDNTADANKNVKYATSAGSAAKGTNNKFETTFLTLGSNGNEPSVTMYNSVSGDGTLKVGINPNDTAMGSSGRNLYLPIGSMYSSNQATLATVEYLNSNFVSLDKSLFEYVTFTNSFPNGRYFGILLHVKSGATGLLSGLSNVQINFTNSGIQLEKQSSTTGAWTTVWSK